MRQTIGLFGGAFKPFHIGHYAAIQKIVNETDKVVLFVSNKDRIKRDEFPLLWDNMREVWNKYLIDALPNNVDVIFAANPITAIYETLEEAEEDLNNHNSYYVYASSEDVSRRFNDEKMKKYFSRLYSEEQIEIRETARVASGTEMRKRLLSGDVEGFTASLPEPVQRYGQEIFDILSDVPAGLQPT